MHKSNRTTIDAIRNIAFTGHSGAGKTSLIERLLFDTQSIEALGEVSRGTTVCDFDSQSTLLQHSVESSLCHLKHNHVHLNMLDTPGYPDFIGRSISVFPAVESVAVVIDASTGIEIMTERMLEAAKQREKCRIIIINKIDALDFDVSELVETIQQRFGRECLPLNLPVPGHGAVVDCYFDPQKTNTEFCSVSHAHDALVDQVVELDDALMDLYIEQGQALVPAQLHDAFETALRCHHLIPICFVSARTGVGTSELLRILTTLMPTPSEGNPPLFLNENAPITLSRQPEDSIVAHVFKVSVDPFKGKLAVLRVHQGTIVPDSQLYVGDSRKAIKITHLYRVQGNALKEVKSVQPGDVCAIAKVDELHFDSVLHASHDYDALHLKSLHFPSPMYGLSIRPQRLGDEQKLSETLKKLITEDPSLRLEHRINVNETVLHGVGEFHLRIALEKMARVFNLHVETQPPSIDYRETIGRSAMGHYRHKKQTGGAGQFGEVSLSVEPLNRGAGFEFLNKVVGGAIPGSFIPAVEKGIKQMLQEGVIAGFPMQDIRVTLLDGKHHAVDSKEIAFVAAGRKAFLDAATKAAALILEPIVMVSITAPTDCTGDITGDIASHRGIVTNVTPTHRQQAHISAKIPLAELFNYPSRIKSMTGGEGSFTITFSHYDPAPKPVQQSLSEDYRVVEFTT